MGCAGSKMVDDLEAVVLCRLRSQQLAEAIDHRYALADAHASYLQSLRSFGLSLDRFFVMPPSASPVLTLPPQRKGDATLPSLSHVYPAPSPSPPPPPALAGLAAAEAVQHRHSHSNSGSHLHFRSSDDEDDDDDDGPLHSDRSSPLHHHLELDDNEITTTTTTKTYYNFARKGPPASAVTYEQQPFGGDMMNHVQGGGGDPSMVPSGSSYPPRYYGDPYLNQNQNYYYDAAAAAAGGYASSYPYPHPSGYGGGIMMGGGGFFGSSPPPSTTAAAPPPPPAEASPSSRAPPPPPSPPKASTWDFLNPFEAYENFNQIYTPSRSSRDLREEEGIPDLEDDEHEVVKEAYGDEKFAAGPSTSSAKGGDLHSTGKGVAMEEDGKGGVGEEKRYQARNSGAREGEVRLTEKNVVVDEVLQRPFEGELRRKVIPGSRSVQDAVHEIKAQFDRASASCEEISKMLEVGKLPYHRRKYEVVSSKMRNAITPSLSTAAASTTSTSSEPSDKASVLHLDFDEEKGMKSGNLSSTLQKLYIWEKKLLEEVKDEEMMRLRHDRKYKKLSRLNDRGAENHKIESTRTLVVKLSTKIGIAIQVVGSISNRIDKLRDEDLWPQLHELIQGLIRMWQVMTECHRSQCQAVIESNGLDAVVSAFAGKFRDEHMDAAMHLGLELLNWTEIFCSWIDAQKCYVRSLNGWLMKCLPDEQEETADGVAPFSPGRLGAPPAFVICNHWSQAIDRISEKEVIAAMLSFTSSFLQVWKLHYGERRQRMLANREMDRQLKALERNDQKIHKAVETLNKRQALDARQSGEILHLNQATEISNPQGALQKIFEAMERYSESSLKAYEQLGIRCKEENDTRSNART